MVLGTSHPQILPSHIRFPLLVFPIPLSRNTKSSKGKGQRKRRIECSVIIRTHTFSTNKAAENENDTPTPQARFSTSVSVSASVLPRHYLSHPSIPSPPRPSHINPHFPPPLLAPTPQNLTHKPFHKPTKAPSIHALSQLHLPIHLNTRRTYIPLSPIPSGPINSRADPRTNLFEIRVLISRLPPYPGPSPGPHTPALLSKCAPSTWWFADSVCCPGRACWLMLGFFFCWMYLCLDCTLSGPGTGTVCQGRAGQSRARQCRTAARQTGKMYTEEKGTRMLV